MDVPHIPSRAVLPTVFILAVACAAGWTSRSLAVEKKDAQVQLEFGVKVALKGAWGEAAFRFERSIKAGGETARTWNNLAVARENLGEYEKAREAYEKAVALDPDDRHIRENLNRFMAFYRSSGRTARSDTPDAP
ncbi:MAG TPA: tetratricopeptide repeat protein [Candidatus Polarisedimenticolia bacterium]|nr:tetratricopeptide repeat protein [Candidatus Polarisedimenticolia bacterium]